MERKYHLVLHTDIGERIGKMVVSVTESKLKGTIYMFGKENSFDGTIDSNGSCRISGTLTTLKNKVNFIANGYMKPSDMLLTLKYKAKTYFLKGCPVKN